MRILSQSEVKTLGLEVRTLPDETQKWFFVSGIMPLQNWATSSDHADFLRNRSRDLVTDRLRGKYCRHITRERPVFDEEFKHSETEEVVILFQLTTDLLLFPRQLEKLGLVSTPGLLYLAVPPFKHHRDLRSAFLPNQDDIEISSNYEDDGNLVYRLSVMPRPELEEIEILLNARELEIPGREEQYRSPGRRWWGYPSHELASSASGRKKSSIQVKPADERLVECFRTDLIAETCSHPLRIFEMPFEFPAGFVRETAIALSNEFRTDCPDFVRTFKDLAFRFDETANEKLRKHQAKSGSDKKPFPRGEPKLEGPDVYWRYGVHPSWVEAILLARLIGGESWNYVLGNLESQYGQSMNWDAPVDLTLRTA